MKKFYFKHFLGTLLLLCSTVASAHDFEVDGIFYNITSSTDKTVAVTYKGSYSYMYFNEYSGAVTIPVSVTYNGTAYSVTTIGDYAFDACSNLTSVTIPNSVTSIGSCAFYTCSSLKTVINLSSLTLTKGSYNYGYVAYYADKVINAPNGSVEGDFVFDIIDGVNTLCVYLGNKTSIVLPQNYKGEDYVIGDNAFYNCTSLASVTIPNSVTTIRNGAFYGCSSLTSVTIPNSVTSIGSYAFEYCSSLANVTIPNSVTEIGSYAFRGCNSLTSVTIPNSVTTIGSYAFYGCSSLTSVTIPNSVKSIGSDAFENCSSLKTVINYSNLTLTKGSTNYGYVAYYADKVINAPNGSVEGDFVFGIINGVNTLCGYLGNDTSIVLPQNYKGENYVIGDYAFYNCTSLTSVTIPNSVTAIGKYAFSGCSSFESVNIPESVTKVGNYAFVNTKWYNNQPNGLLKLNGWLLGYKNTKPTGSLTLKKGERGIADKAFCNCNELTSITIGNSVTAIGSSAFENCSSLTSVTIGNSVKSIGSYAFYNCSSLKEVHITDIAAWCNIDFNDNYSNPLYYAKNLYLNGELVTELVIPEGVIEIKNYAFYCCSNLTSVTIPNSVTTIGDYAFNTCFSLTSVTIPNSVTTIGDYAFQACTSLTSVTIPNCVTTIGDYAFNACFSLTSVTIPNSVTTIGDYAFNTCISLTSVTIGNSVTSIGDYAFYGCDNLTSVINYSNLILTKGSSDYGYVAYYADKVINAPNGFIEGDYAWSITDDVNTLCAYLGNKTSIVLPQNYKGENYAIGNRVFKDYTSLTSVTIPNSVTSIGSYAFYNCSSLTSVTIGNSVTSIGNYAFNDCTSLKSITIPNNVTSIGSDAFENCSSLTSVTIGNSVTAIGSSAFYGCTGLTSVTIPNCVTTIGNHAFYNCSNLASATIGNSVTTIGWGAFNGCSRLTSITIPNSVTSIGSSAFERCSRLTEIYAMAETPATISSGTFNNYSATLYIPFGSRTAYQTANYWKYFANVVEIDFETGDVHKVFEEWASTNKKDNTTSFQTYSLEVTAGSVLSFDWVVSSEKDYDQFFITLDGNEIIKASGEDSGSYTHTFEQAGTYNLKAEYVKDDGYSEGDDYGKIYNILLMVAGEKEEGTTIPGDINGDNKVDVGDVTILIGMILDASLLTDSGDINGDNKVDVGDVTTLVAIILGTNNTPARAAAMEEYNVELSVEGDEQSLTIDATATDYPYSAVQFDVYLPAGVKAIGNMVVGCGNAAAYKEQADGAVRVVIYSPSNTAIAHKAASIAIDAAGLALGSHPVEVKNIILAAPGRAKAIAWDSTGYITIDGTTGIDGVVSDAGNADAVVYDLQGHRVTEIVKGRVYIKNGSKFIAQ